MGLGLGTAESVTDDVVGIAEFISNPAAAYEGIKALLSNPDVLDAMTDAVVQSYEMRLAKIEYTLEVGGDHNAVMLGDELASLAYDFGSLLSGIKTGAITLPKLAAQAGDVAAEVARQTASKADNVVDVVAEISGEVGAMRGGNSKIEKTNENTSEPHAIRSSVEHETSTRQYIEAQSATDPVSTDTRTLADELTVTENLNYYLKLVDNLNVTISKNGAVFYSGRGNRELAEQFAISNGRMTLEMTEGGRWLDQQKLFGPNSPLTPEEAVQVWSKKFAEETAGNAVGFVDGARPTGIFNTIEYPALLRNPAVTNVITGGH